MHIEDWNGARVAAALAALSDAGIPQSRMARLAQVNRSQVNRWSRGENRPGYDPVRRLAAAVYRDHPEIARELVEASGYAWSEPQDAPDPLPAIARENPKMGDALLSAYEGDTGKALTALRAVLEVEARTSGQRRA